MPNLLELDPCRMNLSHGWRCKQVVSCSRLLAPCIGLDDLHRLQLYMHGLAIAIGKSKLMDKAVRCCYAKEIWFLVSNWVGSCADVLTGTNGNIQEWWSITLAPLNAKQRRSVATILMYATWNIWKERNRRIFDNKTLWPDQVFRLIQNDILIRRRACGTPLLQEELLVS
uniref:Reverse transcriptase zinc-binding domain-containing protein n=1 Tax=Setaria viridis TaxID=4556 RepID=A0A4V6D2N8_SETVI|nr:hypothetical protein SEVIR_8G038900v2 [Setaria viridis]